MNYIQRFVNNGDSVSKRAITNIDLFELKFMATSATAGYRIFNAVKLNSLDVWSANISVPGTNTIEVELLTNNQYSGAPSKIYSDSAIGISDIAHVHVKPAKASFVGSWLPLPVSGSPITLMYLTIPRYSAIDINLTVDLIDEESPQIINNAIAGATLGTLYTRPLDSDNATPDLLPIGVSYV